MTQIVLPYRPQAGEPEDISQIMADFDAVTNVVNGDIRDDNISLSAAISASKIGVIPSSQVTITRSATPPATPNDGDLWQCTVNASGGLYWLFRYNSASLSAYKWEFVGGPPGEAWEAAGVTVGTGYAVLNPFLVVPRPGTYLLHHTSMASCTTNTPGIWFETTWVYAPGGAAVPGAASVLATLQGGGPSCAIISPAGPAIDLPAGQVTVAGHCAVADGNWRNRYNRIQPVRVS